MFRGSGPRGHQHNIDEDTVETSNSGTPPLHEDGLPELVAEHAGEESTGRLQATTDYDISPDMDVTFLCLPTPQNDDGSIDLSIREAGAAQIGQTLGTTDSWHAIIVKSTGIPGTTEGVIASVLEEESGRLPVWTSVSE